MKTFGGNSGYVGYSISKRAAYAKEEGCFPKTEFKKYYGVSAAVFNVLVDIDVINDNEWHHTSMYGNKTTFYKWAEDFDNPEKGFYEIFCENKKEITALVRSIGKAPRMEYPAGCENDYERLEMLVRECDKKWKEWNIRRKSIIDNIETIFFGE